MTRVVETRESESATLCKACGLCCTGHLYAWAALEPKEIATTRALGLTVVQPAPKRQGFSLPCPRWDGQCTIYTHSDKPEVCDAFQCKLLKEVQAEQTPVAQALTVVDRAKEMIRELEALSPASSRKSFRVSLIEQVKQLERAAVPGEDGLAFRLKAGVLLIFVGREFGVEGLFNEAKKDESSN